MDVLAIYDSGWFGQRAQGNLETEPSSPQAQRHNRRGSVGSTGDLVGAAEQGGDAASSRDRRQHGPSSTQQQAAYLTRNCGGRPAGQQNGMVQEEDGVLGTWAGRQRIFSDHLRQEAQQQNGGQQQQHGQRRQHYSKQSPVPEEEEEEMVEEEEEQGGEGSSLGAVVLRPPPVAQRGGESPPFLAGRGHPQTEAHPVADSLDQEMNAAWRWRFTRKWQAEQMKQFEAPAAPGGVGEEAEDEEEWTAALRMLEAADGGLNLQIGRTLSLQNSGHAENSVGQSLTLLSPGLSQCMLLDGSIKESPLHEEGPAATSALVSVARKAQHLRRQQVEIERRVSERWEAASSGSPWVAHHLPAVQIDNWSAFPFVLVRLSEPQRSQRQKLLVRGRNGSTEHQAFAATEQEAARAAVAHRLAGPRVELVASGRMEWVAAPVAAAAGSSAPLRRTLRVRASRLLPPAAKDTRLHSLAGASAVVAEVTRASFPSGDFDIIVVDRGQK